MAVVHQPLLSSTSWSSIADSKSNTIPIASSSSSNGANICIEELNVFQSTHRTYIVRFYNDRICTIITHAAWVVDQWISSIYTDFRNNLDNLVVGLDCEWKASDKDSAAFKSKRKKKKGSARNKVAVLQLCVADRCLIFQFACRDSIPPSLYEFLNDEKFRFVGVAVDEDGKKLHKDYELTVAKTIDLRTLAAEKLGRTELCRAGLKSLTQIVLAQDLPKPIDVTLSEWDARLLTDRQIEYACLDAFVSCKLALVLMRGF
ncbi:hypothetical protein MKW94_019841 [Papaver nudicaule]|uniref:3'-5' exonuclease domain-containing protein n=1 Tax=Papaver nudicaule TaxID=74823 RepID=A0AA41V667_PAPNU|nr:hypothetical protein [Papaver nudicaule]